MYREKVMVHSGSQTRPGTGSLHPVAIGAAVEATRPLITVTGQREAAGNARTELRQPILERIEDDDGEMREVTFVACSHSEPVKVSSGCDHRVLREGVRLAMD